MLFSSLSILITVPPSTYQVNDHQAVCEFSCCGYLDLFGGLNAVAFAGVPVTWLRAGHVCLLLPPEVRFTARIELNVGV